MLAAQMDNWDVVFVVSTAVMIGNFFMLLHLLLAHRPRGGKSG